MTRTCIGNRTERATHGMGNVKQTQTDKINVDSELHVFITPHRTKDAVHASWVYFERCMVHASLVEFKRCMFTQLEFVK